MTFAIVAALLSAGLTAAIIWRYERKLARVNHDLDELVQNRTRELVQSRHAVIFGLAKLAESRDDQTGKHLDRIRNYVLILGRELSKTHPEFDDEFIETLADTSSLHDIGKVGIPDSVLLSPDRLSDQQRQIINKHPLIGGDTLLAIRNVWGTDPFIITACEVVFAHHERWDGTGYPFGLAGEDIPLSGRIVALADVYDALTTRRAYKEAVSHDQACSIIADGSGSHFDPQVVEAFEASESEFAQVLRDHQPEPPMVQIDILPVHGQRVAAT